METVHKQFRKRNAILSCLQATKTHPSADMLHALLQEDHPDISLGTVYRNLALFKSQGTIMSLGTFGGAERFDGNTAPHVHFVCTRCYDIIDLSDMQTPDSLCSAAAESAGGKVDACQLTFTGVCGKCLNL